MSRTTLKFSHSDPFGAHSAVEHMKAEAAKKLPKAKHVGTATTSFPQEDGTYLFETVTHWEH